jgi:hypothetical protein
LKTRPAIVRITLAGWPVPRAASSDERTQEYLVSGEFEVTHAIKPASGLSTTAKGD